MASNQIVLAAGTRIWITSEVTISNDLEVTGAVVAQGEGTFNGGHTVSQHTHGGVASGGTDTATPTG